MTLRGPALLFCPGNRSERFAKAMAAADTVVLDLAPVLAHAREVLRQAGVDAQTSSDFVEP